jgi:lipoic acid synthetase
LSSSELQTKKKPAWLKVKFPSHQNYFQVSHLIKEHKIHTICQSAKCPNIAECWTHRTATFLILGDICTRQCAFCAVKKGTPAPPALDEAARVAHTAAAMDLRYVIVTSVTRDDLADGGGFLFVDTIRAIRQKIPQAKIEVLTPDFQGNQEALMSVVAAQPDIFNHNVEVPESLYPAINRPQTNYRRTLTVLERAKEFGAITKSGMMIGLGESTEDILRAFSDLRRAGCSLLTIGQYLQPTRKNAPVQKYYSPLEFEQLKKIALDFGFEQVEAGPLVRSSYRAHRMYSAYLAKRTH